MMLSDNPRSRRASPVLLRGAAVVTLIFGLAPWRWPGELARAESTQSCRRRGCKLNIDNMKCVCPARRIAPTPPITPPVTPVPIDVPTLLRRAQGQCQGTPARAIDTTEAKSVALHPAVEPLRTPAFQISLVRLGKLAAQKENVLRQQVGLLETSLGQADPDASVYPDYLYRVAEHYLALSLNQREAAKAAIGTALANSASLLHQRSDWWMKKAFVQYAKIISNPKHSLYARLDEVHFSLGAIAGILAEETTDSAKKTEYRAVMHNQFSRLTREHPLSRYILDAFVLKGDSLLEAGSLTEVVQAYKTAVDKYTQMSVDLQYYARYRLGSSYLLQKSAPSALVHLIEAAKIGRGASADLRTKLERAVEVGLVRVAAMNFQPDKIGAVLGLVTGSADAQAQKEITHRLGLIALAEAQPMLAVEIWAEALRRWPQDTMACRWVATIMRLRGELGK